MAPRIFLFLFLLILSAPVYLQAQVSSAVSTSATAARELRLKMSDGTELYVKVSGKGRPCLFIHGGPGAWSHSFEVLGLNTLEDSLQMVYVDQRGCGRSGKAATGDYSLARMTKDFDEIRQQLGLTKWAVLAHSFGGIMATKYASLYPQTVSRMIMLNTTLHLYSSAQEQIDKGLELLKLADSSPFTDQNTPLVERFFSMNRLLNEKQLYHQLQYTTKEGLQKMNEEDAKNPGNYDFAQVALNQQEYFEDYREVSSQLKMPVLVISGQQDYAVGPNHYKGFKFQNQTVVSMPGAHVLYMEQNEQFQKAIKQFLKKTSRKS